MIEWGNALGGLTGDEVAHGLDSWREDWPPTMWEFFKACRPPAKASSHREYKSLPGQKINHGPASISHYTKEVQKKLKEIDMLPKDGESHHDYCLRCKEAAMKNEISARFQS